MNRPLFFCFLAVASALIPHSLQAEDVHAKSVVLQDVEAKLKAEWKEKEAMAAKIDSLNADLDNTKKKLLPVAKSIQQNEAELRDIENRIASREEEKLKIEEKLEADRASLSRLVLALERVRRVPPEVMLSRPGTPYKTAQSAMLLKNILPALDKHATELRETLEDLDDITAALDEARSDALKANEKLKKKQEDLSELVTMRETLFKETHKNIVQQEKEIQKISAQAKNLEDLVTRLGKKEEAKPKEEPLAKGFTFSGKKSGTSPQGAGPRLPVAGTLLVGYHEKDDVGASSNGLTLEGQSGGLVVAPMSGKIQFAGPFKRYGNLIIIEHEKGFHSLVAGLEKIDTVVGQNVVAGEPLGLMPRSSGSRPKLYYELRQNGQPVDPSVKFGDLG